jgi:hypothetical protein
MAKDSNNEELKQQALRSMAQGRAEISRDVQNLRKELSPARLVHRVVDRHATLLVILALTTGVIPALFLFRGKRPPDRVRDPVVVSVSKTPPPSLLGVMLTGALGALGKTALPVLVKSVILPRLLDSLSGRSRGAPPTCGR